MLALVVVRCLWEEECCVKIVGRLMMVEEVVREVERSTVFIEVESELGDEM